MMNQKEGSLMEKGEQIEKDLFDHLEERKAVFTAAPPQNLPTVSSSPMQEVLDSMKGKEYLNKDESDALVIYIGTLDKKDIKDFWKVFHATYTELATKFYKESKEAMKLILDALSSKE